ncbi:hypothetical protein V6Z11_D02G136100 [Gossypium hirsutum]
MLNQDIRKARVIKYGFNETKAWFLGVCSFIQVFLYS